MSANATKVMYLLDRYEGPHAGTEGQLMQLIQHLDRARFEPEMTLLRASEYTERHALPCPARVLGIDSLASARALRIIFRFAADLRRRGFSLVHCYFNDVSMIAPPVLKLFGIRVIVSRRDMGFWYNRWNLAALRLAARFVDRCIANSIAVKRFVSRREWMPGNRISVIYNGYAPRDPALVEADPGCEPGAVPDGARIVGIVANLKPIKRIDDLVRAFAIVLRRVPDAYLVSIGASDRPSQGPSNRQRQEELCRQLGIRDRVLFTGQLADPATYVRRFSVAVLCSESEGFSNAIIEYMQAGRPVVCTDTGGNPELVSEGQNGFLVPVGDVKALADRIIRLLTDRALAERMGKASLEAVQSRYSHTRMVQEHMDCYDQVLAGRTSARYAGASVDTLH